MSVLSGTSHSASLGEAQAERGILDGKAYAAGARPQLDCLRADGFDGEPLEGVADAIHMAVDDDRRLVGTDTLQDGPHRKRHFAHAGWGAPTHAEGVGEAPGSLAGTDRLRGEFNHAVRIGHVNGDRAGISEGGKGGARNRRGHKSLKVCGPQDRSLGQRSQKNDEQVGLYVR